jgi:hypothetical protein
LVDRVKLYSAEGFTFYRNMILRKVAYFSKICYHTEFEDSSLSGASAVTTLVVHLHDHHDCIIGGRKVKIANPVVHNVHTKFYDSSSTGLKVIRGKIDT